MRDVRVSIPAAPPSSYTGRTPQPAIDKLNDTMVTCHERSGGRQAVRRSAACRDRAAKEKFGELIKSDTEKWRKVMSEANIELE